MIKNIKSTNMELTSAISDYVETKVASLKKLLPEVDQDSVIMSIELGKNTNHHKNGDVFFAEMNITNYGKDLRARHESDNLYSAIDKVKDQITDILRTNKGKEITKTRNKKGRK